MVPLSAIWLPILLAAVAVFIASAIVHMVLPIHRSDYKPLPEEAGVLAALRASNPKPGLYMFPDCNRKELNSPATIAKFKEGPVGTITIIPSGPPAMSKMLVLWFIYCLIVSAIVGCLAQHTVPPGEPHHLFHVTAATAFLAYGVSQMVNSIWRCIPWGITLKELIDGLVYAIITGLIFLAFWPH